LPSGLGRVVLPVALAARPARGVVPHKIRRYGRIPDVPIATTGSAWLLLVDRLYVLFGQMVRGA